MSDTCKHNLRLDIRACRYGHDYQGEVFSQHPWAFSICLTVPQGTVGPCKLLLVTLSQIAASGQAITAQDVDVLGGGSQFHINLSSVRKQHLRRSASEREIRLGQQAAWGVCRSPPSWDDLRSSTGGMARGGRGRRRALKNPLQPPRCRRRCLRGRPWRGSRRVGRSRAGPGCSSATLAASPARMHSEAFKLPRRPPSRNDAVSGVFLSNVDMHRGREAKEIIHYAPFSERNVHGISTPAAPWQMQP